MDALPAIAALHRRAFRFSAYSGLRALRNRVRSRHLGQPGMTRVLAGKVFGMPGCGKVRASVHARPCPADAPHDARFGMISLRRVRPPVATALYRYLCLTSHFGCGELETAFYEASGRITLFAFRATGLAHATRFGWHRTARRLAVGWQEEDVLRALVSELEQAGLHVRFAPPAECVRLSFDARLVRPNAVHRTQVALEKKYRRLTRDLALPAADCLDASRPGDHAPAVFGSPGESRFSRIPPLVRVNQRP